MDLQKYFNNEPSCQDVDRVNSDYEINRHAELVYTHNVCFDKLKNKFPQQYKELVTELDQKRKKVMILIGSLFLVLFVLFVAALFGKE